MIRTYHNLDLIWLYKKWGYSPINFNLRESIKFKLNLVSNATIRLEPKSKSGYSKLMQDDKDWFY